MINQRLVGAFRSRLCATCQTLVNKAAPSRR
jgi:hypothetical protein